MAEKQSDQKLIEWLDFPAPPYRLAGSLSRARLIAGYVALCILFAAGAAVLVGYFGFTNSGRSLLTDSALAAGLGSPLPDAYVELGGCDYSGSRAGSRVPGQWRCEAFVVANSERTVVLVETVTRIDNLRPLGAGSVVGAIGIYWPLGTLAARWWNALFLIIIGGGLIGLSITIGAMARNARAPEQLRSGKVRSVDLLTWKGRPWFAFVDDAGVRHFQQADQAMFPLVLDGVRTTGAALVQGSTAMLLQSNLLPMKLDAARHTALLDRAGQVQRQCQIRSALPPQPGDPDSLAGRIGRVEEALPGKPSSVELEKLYDEAWRLVWDSNDTGVADRALAARDSIALRLGPAATHAALRACREASTPVG